jgi:hypothetical protein
MNSIAEKMPESVISEEDPTCKEMTDTTTLSKLGLDDRQSCRCTVPQARRPCELKAGANLLSASLVNQSEDGLAVLIDRLDGLKVGQNVELHTDSGWFMVDVVYINKVAPPKDAAPECDSWFRLGIKIKQRLKEQQQ